MLVSERTAFIRTFATRLSKNKAFHRHLVLAFTSTALTTAIGVVSTPVMAYLLPRADYGKIVLANSITGLVAAFSAPGVANAIAFSVARGYEGSFQQGTAHRVRAFLRNSFYLLPVAGWYFWFANDASFALLMCLAGLTLPWAAGFDTGEQLLVGRSDFATLFWRRLIVAAAIALAGMFAAFLYPDALAVYLTRAIASAVLLLLIYGYLLGTIHNPEQDPLFWEKVQRFNTISVLTAIGGVTDKLVLGNTGDLGVLAGYSLAATLVAPLDLASKSLIKVLFGRFATPRELKERRLYVVLTIVSLAFGIASLLSLLAPLSQIVAIVFPKYPEIASYLPLIILTSLFHLAAAVPSTYGLFHSFAWWSAYNTWRNGTRIIVVGAATLYFGVWGAIYAMLGYAMFDYGTFSVVLWRQDA